VRTADSSIVGLPIIPALTRDSLLTITVSGIPFSALGLNDPDQNVNATASFARLSVLNAFPDFAPDQGHGTIGTETGASWISAPVWNLSVPAGDSAALPVSVLAARSAGTYSAHLLASAPGQPTQRIPVTMTVTGAGNGHIQLSLSTIADTVQAGDSVAVPLTVSNTGTADLYWGIIDTALTPWVSVMPPAGQTAPGDTTNVTVMLRSAGIPAGTTASTTLLVVANDTVQTPMSLPVSLRVLPFTGVSPEEGIPASFALHQNYPNPFNPATSIRLDLPAASSVSMVVYDILGRETAVLAEGLLPAGIHRFTWEARSAASGVYIVRVQAGASSAVRRMLLIR
jgi:hypothetical protein